MKFKTGTKVKFLNDIGGGIVTGYQDARTALVRGEDGFEMPVLENDLVPDTESSYEEEASHAAETVAAAGPEEQVLHDTGFTGEWEDTAPRDDPEPGRTYLAFIRGEGFYGVHLVNDGPYHILYNLSLQRGNYYEDQDSGFLEHDTKVHLMDLVHNDMDETAVFLVQAIYFNKGMHRQLDVLDHRLEIRLDHLKNGFYEASNDYFNERASLFLLGREIPDAEDYAESVESRKDEIEDKDAAEDAKNKVHEKKEKPGIPEVDLHIHELIESSAGMSNGEILEIQMNTFRRELEKAIENKIPRIVFIHGVGNGKLKFELRKELDQQYPRLRYQDASFQEYGFGATMVLIR